MTFKFSHSEFEGACKKLLGYIKPGNYYVIEIQRAASKRSLNQNRYYWGVVVDLFAQNTGYTKEESHQELAGMFLKYEAHGKPFTRSTTTLTTLEFEQYADKCRQWMGEMLGINVPLPNEVSEEFLMQMRNIYNY
jgi:hypothetical protein